MSIPSDDSQGPEQRATATMAEETQVATVTTATDSKPPDGANTLLSRTEAARAFDVSVTTFRRRYEGRLLTPVVGADGVHYFRQEAVHELVIQQRGAAALDAYDGEMAAMVFRHFEEGADAVDVVVRLKLHPHAVAAMHKEWVALRGGYVVSSEVARQIASLPWMCGALPICDGERLLANLRATTPRGPCADCRSALAEVCAPCARRMAIKEADRRAAEARERQEELEERKRAAEWEKDFAAMRRRRKKTP